MNSKSLTVVLVVAILVSTLSPQTEAFTMGAGGFSNGKRQLGSCEEVMPFVSSLFTATY